MEELRNEYPRPQFMRKEWKNLNGKWDFRFGHENWQEIIVLLYFRAV